jgi:hypothetical protein
MVDAIGQDALAIRSGAARGPVGPKTFAESIMPQMLAAISRAGRNAATLLSIHSRKLWYAEW